MNFKKLLVSLSLLSFTPAFSQFSGNALDFDGANDMVVVNSVPAYFSSLGTNDFTFEAWVNPRGAVFSRIFFAQAATNNFTAVSTGATNNIYFYVVVNGTNYSVATTATLPQNQWTHVAARWTAAGSQVQVFFNGVLQAGIGGGTSSTGTSGLMTLGTRPGGAQYFNGVLDEARLWNEARTDCEILANMNNSITGTQVNLTANYDFNQGVASGNNAGVTSLPDLSGNSYNGTLTNFALTGATSNWISSAATVNSSGGPLGGYTATQNVSVCSGGNYTFPDGSTQTNITAPVSYVSSVPGPSGCDSLITTNVSVNAVYSINDTVSVCSGGSHTFPDGSTQTNITSTTNQASTLQTQAGCDSVINTLVNVLQPSAFSETAAVCEGDSYTFPDSTTQNNITSQVIHTSTLVNSAGCDSVVTTTVNVNAVYAMADSATICAGDSYTFPDGSSQTNITSAVIYTSQLASVAGCDSLVTTSLAVNQVDTMVSVTSVTLTASASGATYQWLDCVNGYVILPGDTSQNFTATVNGTYAVAVTQNGCTDTSGCHVILSTSLDHALNGTSVRVYPNPAHDLLMIETSGLAGGTIELTDIAGAVVLRTNFSSSVISVDLSGLAAGTYFARLDTPEGKIVKKVQKQ
ncbi:MAG: hypothetical protein FD123_2923 [Bacteroidetes bacterium]|nr:MAG: hypothetical protein FD123_2923 [Bacteroidota bacterium]